MSRGECLGIFLEVYINGLQSCMYFNTCFAFTSSMDSSSFSWKKDERSHKRKGDRSHSRMNSFPEDTREGLK